MSTEERVQSVRNGWTNALRAEVLRVGRTVPEVARVATVGVWIATYADADGSNAFPSRETLATLAGCSQETVTRAVKVLMGVRMLERKRRPNASSVYQLALPIGRVDWTKHIHHMTDTRQRKARAKEKAERLAEMSRTASPDAVENPGDNQSDSVPGRSPDSVPGGGSGTSESDPDSVRGRPRTASPDTFRTASPAGVYQYLPTSGRDPLPNHTPLGFEPQPQPRAGEAGKDESSTTEKPGKPADAALAAVEARDILARCEDPDCDMALPYGRTGLCQGCADYRQRNERNAS
ncbi:helix-turn-helix domain-containing protein [Streptomyces sp. NPDC016845]|uniref:helix-turn-helix domain-containing protein n=1 Tax=Streptomyces sp. NPDC016845 TaxID=3364972 RepID=UPI0037B5D4E8